MLEIEFDKNNHGRLSKSKSNQAFVVAIKASALDLSSWLPNSLKVREAFRECETPEQSDALSRLLIAVGTKKTKMFEEYYHVQKYGKNQLNSYFSAILLMARYCDKWIRQPEDWQRNSHNASRQFISLAKHLFAKYDIPDFMHSAWFEERESNWKLGIEPEWYIHVAQGGNIRTCNNLPIPMTKKNGAYISTGTKHFDH